MRRLRERGRDFWRQRMERTRQQAFRAYHKWTSDDDRLVNDHSVNDGVLARQLNRSIHAIQDRRYLLRLVHPKRVVVPCLPSRHKRGRPRRGRG